MVVRVKDTKSAEFLDRVMTNSGTSVSSLEQVTNIDSQATVKELNIKTAMIERLEIGARIERCVVSSHVKFERDPSTGGEETGLRSWPRVAIRGVSTNRVRSSVFSDRDAELSPRSTPCVEYSMNTSPPRNTAKLSISLTILNQIRRVRYRWKGLEVWNPLLTSFWPTIWPK